MMVIKYSFIVAIYNVSKYLPRCLDSLVSQSFNRSEYEIILVDDGSTDNSGVICDDYSNKHTNVRVIHQDNRGLLMARGAGVRIAAGRYLILVDGDDFVEANLLSTVDAQIDEYKPDFLMYSMCRDYDGHLKPSYVTKKEIEVLDKNQMLERFVGTDRYNCVWGKIIKKELLSDHIEEIYDRRLNIAEDKIQTAYLLKYSDRIILTHDVLYHYCIRQDSIIKKKNKQDIMDVIYAYSRVRSVIEDICFNEIITEDEREKLLNCYDRCATDTMLDHVYKFLRQKNYSESDKIGVLQSVNQYETVFMQRAKRIETELKLYNRIRYTLLVKEKYEELLKHDERLYIVQSILYVIGNMFKPYNNITQCFNYRKEEKMAESKNSNISENNNDRVLDHLLVFFGKVGGLFTKDNFTVLTWVFSAFTVFLVWIVKTIGFESEAGKLAAYEISSIYVESEDRFFYLLIEYMALLIIAGISNCMYYSFSIRRKKISLFVLWIVEVVFVFLGILYIGINSDIRTLIVEFCQFSIAYRVGMGLLLLVLCVLLVCFVNLYAISASCSDNNKTGGTNDDNKSEMNISKRVLISLAVLVVLSSILIVGFRLMGQLNEKARTTYWVVVEDKDELGLDGYPTKYLIDDRYHLFAIVYETKNKVFLSSIYKVNDEYAIDTKNIIIRDNNNHFMIRMYNLKKDIVMED